MRQVQSDEDGRGNTSTVNRVVDHADGNGNPCQQDDHDFESVLVVERQKEHGGHKCANDRSN